MLRIRRKFALAWIYITCHWNYGKFFRTTVFVLKVTFYRTMVISVVMLGDKWYLPQSTVKKSLLKLIITLLTYIKINDTIVNNNGNHRVH